MEHDLGRVKPNKGVKIDAEYSPPFRRAAALDRSMAVMALVTQGTSGCVSLVAAESQNLLERADFAAETALPGLGGKRAVEA